MSRRLRCNTAPPIDYLSHGLPHGGFWVLPSCVPPIGKI